MLRRNTARHNTSTPRQGQRAGRWRWSRYAGRFRWWCAACRVVDPGIFVTPSWFPA